MESDNATVNALTEAQKELLKQAIEGTVLTDAEKATFTGNAATLRNEILLNKVRSIALDQPILRVSKVVSSFYSVKAAHTNVGRIISTGTLSLQEAIPNTILFNLPSFTTTKPGRTIGWRKRFPTVQVSGHNHYSISQSWEYGLWATVFWGAAM